MGGEEKVTMMTSLKNETYRRTLIPVKSNRYKGGLIKKNIP